MADFDGTNFFVLVLYLVTLTRSSGEILVSEEYFIILKDFPYNFYKANKLFLRGVIQLFKSGFPNNTKSFDRSSLLIYAKINPYHGKNDFKTRYHQGSR